MHTDEFGVLYNIVSVLLCMQKNGGRLTLKNISFSCGQNARMMAIVGPVGAGKVRHYVQYIHALACVYAKWCSAAMYIHPSWFMAGPLALHE